MKINKEQMASLAELDDRALWQTITKIAEEHGYRLSENPPSGAELEKVRAALRGTEKLNMRDAVKLLNNYKKRGTNG